MNKELIELERFIKTNSEVIEMLYDDYFKFIYKNNIQSQYKEKQVTESIKKIRILSVTLKDKIHKLTACDAG